MAIAGRVFLHTVYFGSSRLRGEEASGGSKSDVAATVPVWSAANGLHATATTTADDSAAASDADAAFERSLSPGASASDDVYDSAKSSSASCRAASTATPIAATIAASGPASASSAHRPCLESYTRLRLDEVKASILFRTSSLKDGVSLFSLSRHSWALGGLIEGRASRHWADFPTSLHNSY
jgi:hypothetical protein